VNSSLDFVDICGMIYHAVGVRARTAHGPLSPKVSSACSTARVSTQI
jgi:hypothetical protein